MKRILAIAVLVSSLLGSEKWVKVVDKPNIKDVEAGVSSPALLLGYWGPKVDYLWLTKDNRIADSYSEIYLDTAHYGTLEDVNPRMVGGSKGAFDPRKKETSLPVFGPIPIKKLFSTRLKLAYLAVTEKMILIDESATTEKKFADTLYAVPHTNNGNQHTIVSVTKSEGFNGLLLTACVITRNALEHPDSLKMRVVQISAETGTVAESAPITVPLSDSLFSAVSLIRGETPSIIMFHGSKVYRGQVNSESLVFVDSLELSLPVTSCNHLRMNYTTSINSASGSYRFQELIALSTELGATVVDDETGPITLSTIAAAVMNFRTKKSSDTRQLSVPSARIGFPEMGDRLENGLLVMYALADDGIYEWAHRSVSTAPEKVLNGTSISATVRQGTLRIANLPSGNGVVELIDQRGRIILKESVLFSTGSTEISLKTVASAPYFVRVSTDDGSFSEKIVVK